MSIVERDVQVFPNEFYLILGIYGKALLPWLLPVLNSVQKQSSSGFPFESCQKSCSNFLLPSECHPVASLLSYGKFRQFHDSTAIFDPAGNI